MSSWDPNKETTFISLVQQHPNLWQKTHSDYSNTYCKAKTWGDIAKIMDKTKTEVQKKWKTLKRRMDTEVRNLPKHRSGDGANKIKSKWIHFESMRFVLGEMEYKEPSGNLSEMMSPKVQQYLESDDYSDDDISMPVRNVMKTGEKLQLYSDKNLKYMDEVTNLDNTQQEDDMLFFRTLISHIQIMKPEAKLMFRQEISELVFRYAYNKKPEKAVKQEEDDDVQIIEPRFKRLRRSYPPIGFIQPKVEQLNEWRQYPLTGKKEEQQLPATNLVNITNSIPYQFNGYTEVAQPLSAISQNSSIPSTAAMQNYYQSQQEYVNYFDLPPSTSQLPQ